MNNSGLQRLAYKAGAVRVSSKVYDKVRNVGHQYLESIVRAAVTYCEYENKKTVSEDHAVHAIEHVGFTGWYRTSGEVKRCKPSSKKRLINKIKEYQGQSDCVTLAKATIEAEIKQIGNDFISSIRWSKEALINIHFALEYLIYKLLFSALKVTVNAERRTLLDSDLELTIDLITTNCNKLKL